MTAEGTACNGAGEAPKAEFTPEKAAAPEEKAAAGEREGEDLGGPFVIVNGDSDGHSDRGSDLGAKAPDEDSPSEEEDVPGSNAAPDADVGGDHGAAGGDEGDRAADGSEGGADEREAEPSSDRGSEVAEQEAVGEEDGGADTSASSERGHAATVADSEAPDVDSEVEGKEHAVDGLLVTDVAEAVVQEAASTERDGEDADEVSPGHDVDAVTPAKSCTAATESNINGEDSYETESAADVVKPEPVEQGTDGASVLVDNGHADEVADSFVAATEPETQEEAAAESCAHDDALTCTSEVYVEDSKEEKSAADFVEVVEQGACGDGTLTSNLCADTRADSSEPGIHANESKLEQGATEITDSVEGDADSCIIASDSKVNAIEMEEQETDQQEEAPTTEPEISEGVLKATDRNCAGSVEELIGEEVDASGHCNVEGSADASREQEYMVSEAQGEATCGVLQLEGADVVCSNVEIKVPVEKEINEAAPNVDESVQSGSTEDGVSVCTIRSKASSVESSPENKCNVEVAAGNEIAAESDLKAENVVQVKTVACEVEETEAKELDDANVAPLLSQQGCESALETVVYGKTEIDNDVEVEPKKVSVDVVPIEKPPDDLVDCDSITSATVLESSDHVHTEDSRSREISKTNAEQLVCGASLKHGTVVTGEAEISSATGSGYKEKPSDIVDLNADALVSIDDAQPSSTTGYESGGLDNDVGTLKKDESSEISGDSKSLDIQSEVCNATTSDECSRIGNEGSSRAEEVAPLIEQPCLSDESCNGISSENLNASTELEALEPSSIGTDIPAEQKDADEHASGELHGDHAQIIGPQKMFIIKIPRFAGEDIWAKMEAAQAHLDQLTQQRDAINHRRQKQKDVCDQYRERLDEARRLEREARTAHGDKKNDLNSVRSVLGKLHQANSIEEIDELIVKKERTMQHETISLKEEKLLIKEINDLKAQRKQLSSNIGSKAAINEAFDQRDHIHERHKELKKDSDVLFTNLKSLEENTRKIQKSFDEERIALRKLTEEHRAANEIRQKAYSEWFELKQEPIKKNKYFFMYMNDRKNAEIFRDSGDIYGLMSFCNNQIEKVMEMWNKNEDFRKQYVESNKVRTLKRLGTHDGRRLGPDEEPPAIPSRRPSNTSYLTASNTEVPTLTSIPAPASTLAAPPSVPAKEDSFPVLPPPQISKRAKSKASGNSAQIESSAVTVSEAEDVKQTEKEKARLMEEQLELARKAEELARKEEELRKERAAAEKERLRLEQKAKAKEAEERKRRKAEKDKERAEFKARKEAEEREKKKAKKDKKKGSAPAESSVAGDSNAAALATADTDSNASDNSREVEVPQPSAPKKLSRPAAAIKQLNRVQPMPAPLRNRGKRKMRQYLLIAAAVLSVLALFVAGNYIPRLKSVHF